MSNVIEINNKREMFWDDYLVDRELSNTTCQVNPLGEPKTLRWIDDAVTSYPCLCKVDDEYRMYYIGGAMTDGDFIKEDGSNINISVKVLISKDGLNWTIPEIPGKKPGVVIEKVLDNGFVFRDDNPDCPPDEKFKALSSGYCIDNKYGLYLFVSADGFNFKVSRLLTDKGTFDSCNTLHYIDGRYVCFTRTWHDYTPEPNRTKNMMNEFFDIPTPNEKACRMRSISVLYSDDCKNWTDPVELEYTDDLDHQMYTNNAIVYERAPHMMVGFPTRYCERIKWTDNYEQLSGRDKRFAHYNSDLPRVGMALTDCLFMFSRDTKKWTRFSEAFMTPGYEYEYNWVYGDCYPAFGLIDSGKDYYMMYTIAHHQEHDKQKPVNMYKVRKDGFACHKAGSRESLLVTKPIIFTGKDLHINFETSAYGYIIIDVLDEDGKKIGEKESFEIFGNNIDRKISFEDGTDFSEFAGKPIRLRFRMRDAKLYSMKFE